MLASICSELISLRKAQGLSGYALSKRIGCSRSTLRRWEEGTAVPSLANVASWAAALGYQLMLDGKYELDLDPTAGQVKMLDPAAYNRPGMAVVGILRRNGAPYSIVVRTAAGLYSLLNAGVLKPMPPDLAAVLKL